jgi:hypothetical protein
LFVTAGSAHGVRSVRFFDGRRLIKNVPEGLESLYDTPWKTAKLQRGRHVLRAVVVDRRGRTASAKRVVRVCRK